MAVNKPKKPDPKWPMVIYRYPIAEKVIANGRIFQLIDASKDFCVTTSKTEITISVPGPEVK